MGTNMYPYDSLLKDGDMYGLPVDKLIEKANRFAGVFPEHKYEIVWRLQERKHTCGMTGRWRERHAHAEEGGHRDSGGGRGGRGARRVGHCAHGARPERHHQRHADEPRHLPADEELYTIYAASITIRMVLCYCLPACYRALLMVLNCYGLVYAET
jgi:hypothetical protein